MMDGMYYFTSSLSNGLFLNLFFKVILFQVNLVVEVPPYHNKNVTSAVQVQFYVCNGKRKRSQSQRFSYMPGKSVISLGYILKTQMWGRG